MGAGAGAEGGGGGGGGGEGLEAGGTAAAAEGAGGMLLHAAVPGIPLLLLLLGALGEEAPESLVA